MNLTTIRVRAFYFLVALVFVLGATLPSPAFAQVTGDTTGGATGGGGGRTIVGGVINTVGNFINHPVATTGNLIQSGLNGVTGIVSGISSFVEHPVATTGNLIQSGLQGVNNVVSGISNFVQHPIASTVSAGESVINSAIDAYVELGNSVDWFQGSPGTPAGEGTNAIGGEGPVDLTPSGDGNSDSHPGDLGGSGGSGARPTASRGSVSNPFSTGDSDTTGANSDETGTNNVQTQTNPYLFEYDPNSTNNNPAGSGAQTQ